MASILDKLKALGIGQKSPEQLQREASPVMTAMMNRRAPSYDEIEEQKRLNREQGVWFPLFDGNLRSGERLQNINGITYKIPVGIEIPPNTTGFDLSQDMPTTPPQAPVPPPSATPMRPRSGQLVPEEGLMGRPQDFLPLVERPDLPSYLTAADVPVPVRPDLPSPERRQMPIPGPNEFTPPAMEPQIPQPNIDTETVLNSLLARYDALYSGKPPVAPQPRMPERRDLGLPAFTTPGYVPEGLMSPRVQQPNMIPPAIQPYDPNMIPSYNDDFSKTPEEAIIPNEAVRGMSGEEFDAYIDELTKQYKLR
jgi:hypothetical protein